MKQNSSVLNGGPLQDAIATMSPKTSKLVLINVGGALEFRHTELCSSRRRRRPSKPSNPSTELAKATEKTTIRLLTSEEANSFGIRLSLSDMPPMRQLFGPSPSSRRCSPRPKGKVGKPAKAQTPLSIPQAGRPSDVKGDEAAWAAVPAQPIEHVAYTPPTSQEDLSANFKTLYDSQALYLLVDVTDDVWCTTPPSSGTIDSVEVFIDAENNKSDIYGDKDYQYHFDWELAVHRGRSMGESTTTRPTASSTPSPARQGLSFRGQVALVHAGDHARAGKKIGLDVHVNDDDDGGDRDTKIMWFAEHDVAWQQPSAFGTAELAGLVGWWKLDEKEGRTAADSSGNGHNATVHGNPTWQPSGGKIGGAIALDGNGELPGGRRRIRLRCHRRRHRRRLDQSQRLRQAVAGDRHQGRSTWRIQRNNETNTLEFACTGLHIPGGNEYGSLFGTKEITLDEWHHVAGVYDGKKMYLYVDGALDASQDAWGPINTNDKPVLIGGERARCPTASGTA